MAYFSILSFLLLLLLHSCIASSSKTICQEIPRLMAMEPDTLIPSEAGFLESWNPNYELFQCAGVVVFCYTIEPNGLVLPFYTNYDSSSYIFQGKLVLGLMIPRCSQESSDDEKYDECQEIYRFQSGDVLAVRAGETSWSYNDGNETVIGIRIFRITSEDPLRTFVLAGSDKILEGFSPGFISKAFNIDDELAMKLQRDDFRGVIVYVAGGLLYLSCCRTHDDQDQPKGLIEDSFCNKRIINITDPSGATFYDPQVGLIKTINADRLPILKSIPFTVTYKFFFKDIMRLPHWDNDYKAIYVVKGEGQMQVVDENGNNVFDDIIKEGQLLIVPNGFVMAELAKSKTLEYIIFKTGINTRSSDLTGQDSVIHDLPLDVVKNAYNITEEEAEMVKFGRTERFLAKIM